MTKSSTIGQVLARAKKAAKKGKISEALQLYNTILSRQPDNPIAKKAIHKLQNILPVGSVIRTNNMNPSQEQVNTLVNLLNSGQLEKTEKACKELLNIFPQALVVLNILAGVLSQQGKFNESVQTCDRMIQLKPDFAQAYYNRGVVLQESGKFEDAIKSFSLAIQQKPDYAQAHSDLSLIMLLLGNYKEGWKEHEWRMMEEKNREQVPVAITKWNEESLEGNVILVRAEQGIGDEIMFSSCFPDLISLNPEQIIVECDSRLVTLFTRSFPVMNIQGKRKENNLDWLKEFGSIDFQVAMGSLPMFFRPDLDSFPDRQSFLKHDSALLKKWNSRLAELGEGIKVGVSWRGGSKDSMKVSRSIDLNSWMPILQSDAHFVNLQYGDCTEEIEQLERVSGVRIHDWADADPLTDLDNFAAQISALDLVISIDNSTVHFSGALGVPTWVLMPVIPDWRWMLDRDGTPWYSEVRLFRQKMSGNWSDVISNVKLELERCCDK